MKYIIGGIVCWCFAAGIVMGLWNYDPCPRSILQAMWYGALLFFGGICFPLVLVIVGIGLIITGIVEW